MLKRKKGTFKPKHERLGVTVDVCVTSLAPFGFCSFDFRLPGNTAIKRIRGKFAYRRLPISRRDAEGKKKKKKRGGGNIKKWKKRAVNQKKYKLMKKNQAKELKCKGRAMRRGGGRG